MRSAARAHTSARSPRSSRTLKTPRIRRSPRSSRTLRSPKSPRSSWSLRNPRSPRGTKTCPGTRLLAPRVLTSAVTLLLYLQSASGSVVESHHNPYWEQAFSQPYFDNTTRREVATTVGQGAYLHCRVRNLGDRAVSWIRKRDLHILTVGLQTYTNDQRFQSLHSDGSDEWTLKIGSPQIRDSGTYECQVSTEPKISLSFHLSVVVSKAAILGNPELYLKSGSDINLTCQVVATPDPPSFIYWYRGAKVVNYSQRGGISVVTDKQTRTSTLLIARAQPEDSGNYTCYPSSSDPASVVVHVLNGEHPAAMQHGNNSSGAAAPYSALSAPALILLAASHVLRHVAWSLAAR